MVLAAFPVADLVTLGLLALFALWGAFRGPWRQLASLGLLALGMAAATRYGPRFEDTVVRAVSAQGANLAAVSWSAVLVGVLLAGGLVLALLQPFLGRGRHRRSGAVLGLVHGVVLGTVLVYAALALFGGADAPAWTRSLERSRSAVAARTVGSGLRRLVTLPPWLETRLDLVDERVTRSQGTTDAPIPGVQDVGPGRPAPASE